jgi:hypothetical protein
MWLTTLTDDLDKQVLLTVQYACNEAGVRIPWDDVALKMCEIVGEDKFTGGAIIQHLSKLRSKMESHALKVPPPLRRGLMINAPSKIYAPGNKRKGRSSTAKNPKSSTARLERSKARNLRSEDEDDSEGTPIVYDDDGDDDSDGEYEGGRKKRRYSWGKAKTKKMAAVAVAERKEVDEEENAKAFRAKTPTIKVNIVKRGNLKAEAGIQESIENSGSLPRTRGVKHNYAKMDTGSEGNDEPEDDAQAEGEAEEDEYVEKERRSDGEISPLTKVETSIAGRSGFVVSVPRVEFRSFANNLPIQAAESTQRHPDGGFGLGLGSAYNFSQSDGQHQPYQIQQYQMPAQTDFGFHSANSSFSTNRTGSMASLTSVMAPHAIRYSNPSSYDAVINNDMVISNFGNDDIMYSDQYIPPIDYTPAFHSTFSDPFLGARDNDEKVDYM